jgi:hypothetical protein
MANVNIALLAGRGHDVRKLEHLWRRAKQFMTTEGRKGDYLGAWEFVLRSLGHTVRPVRVDDFIIVGSINAQISAADPEFVTVTGARDLQILLPIIDVLLTQTRTSKQPKPKPKS